MSANSRHLSPTEIARLPAAFTREFDIGAVQLIDRSHNPFTRNKIVCRGPRLYWQDYPENFSRTPMIIQSLLVHELCHVWQYETGRLTAFSYLIDPRNWRYSYRVKDGANFDDYPIEKQADLLQDWFLVNSGAIPVRFDQNGPTPTKDWLNRIVPFSGSETRIKNADAADRGASYQ